MADAGTYLNFYGEIDRYSGEFIDKAGDTRNIETLEEDVFLMREYLKQSGIEIASNIKSFLLSNTIENIPYMVLAGKFLYALLDDEYQKKFTSTSELTDLYNNLLVKKEVKYPDLKQQLMEKVSIK